MEVKSQTKYVRMSSQKGREVLYLIKDKKALEALEVLKFVPRRGAKVIFKALKTAIADAEHNFRLKKEDLYIKKITIDKAPVLKRFRPQAKGAAHPILKKLSHITVVLAGEEKLGKKEVQEVKAKKEKPQVEKKEIAEEKKPEAKPLETTQEKPFEVTQGKPEEIKKEKPKTKEEGVIRKIFRRKSI